MDILIKNMELPKEKDDVVILMIQPEGTTNVFGRRLLSLLRPSAEIRGLRKGITKAIELPPHGYLGDLSELSMTLYSELETQTPKTLGEVMKIIKKVFDEAPTVLEANNG